MLRKLARRISLISKFTTFEIGLCSYKKEGDPASSDRGMMDIHGISTGELDAPKVIHPTRGEPNLVTQSYAGRSIARLAAMCVAKRDCTASLNDSIGHLMACTPSILFRTKVLRRRRVEKLREGWLGEQRGRRFGDKQGLLEKFLSLMMHSLGQQSASY